MIEELITRHIAPLSGKISVYYKNLVTRETVASNSDVAMKAASVIKLPILVEAFQQMETGMLYPEQPYILREEDKRPSCGALNRMHAGLTVTVMDLCNLMIILSDNTATNILIHLLGKEKINASMEQLGYPACRVNRYLFDQEASSKGIENYVSAREIGDMLEKMHQGTLISKSASVEMLDILKEQRLNGKIPFHFRRAIPIAHKTGEDSGITHDVGIVYGAQPFVLCMMGNDVITDVYEQQMQRIAWEIEMENQKSTTY